MVRNHIYSVKDNCRIVFYSYKVFYYEMYGFPDDIFLFINYKLNYNFSIYLTRSHVIFKYRYSLITKIFPQTSNNRLQVQIKF